MIPLNDRIIDLLGVVQMQVEFNERVGPFEEQGAYKQMYLETQYDSSSRRSYTVSIRLRRLSLWPMDFDHVLRI